MTAGVAGKPVVGGAGGLASGGSAGKSGPDMPDPSHVPSCFEPQDGGPCTEFATRYYWDVSTNKCQPFQYGGCEGNDNNFTSYDRCAYYCWEALSCSCAADQPDCHAGVCNDCPLDASLAEGQPCPMVGLSCTGHCDCIVDDAGAEVWQCQIRVQ